MIRNIGYEIQYTPYDTKYKYYIGYDYEIQILHWIRNTKYDIGYEIQNTI